MKQTRFHLIKTEKTVKGTEAKLFLLIQLRKFYGGLRG